MGLKTPQILFTTTGARGLWLPGAAVTDSFESHDMGVGNLNSGPLEEQQMILMVQPSLHLPDPVVLFCFLDGSLSMYLTKL